MSGKFFFCVLFLWLVLNAVFAVPNKKNLYCAVCGKCCKQNLNTTRNSLPQGALLESCFGVSCEETGILCSTCRRALYIYRTTGKTSFQLDKSNKKDKAGRPKKKHRTVPARISSDNNNEGWVAEDTCFGVLQRGANGEVLMPAEMYDDIQMQFNSMSGRCDLKLELEKLKQRIYENFVLGNQPAIYQPNEFIEFCRQAGAPNIFEHILQAVSDDRHSHRRQDLNRVRTVSIIYTMCYCRSQMCNVMQVDNALYLNSNRMTQEGIDTQYRMGHTCSRKTSNIIRSQLSQNHEESLKSFFNQAIQNEWVLVLIIDDFTKIHTYRRPAILRTCNPMSMCTIVVKAFKQLRAIKVPSNISRIHCPDGVDIRACVDAITSPEQLALLSNSYASTMPNWLTTRFFTPDLERHILEEHGYGDESGVRMMRTMDDLHLIDFVELQLIKGWFSPSI
ncbi:Hypothetical predicted protein [Paramuricea clavata]|uniref:Uncharacterized protein n=1 Tax=Paramuricea clavata TaxID=317549 RepID=A0A7D9J7E8_PARCT|nr:Hypothetical predicted protein [Paramuricea clavata]